MTRLLLALAFMATSARIARADGWIDCNGPDKPGRGCATSGRDAASAGSGLLLLAAVTWRVARRRRWPLSRVRGGADGVDRRG